MKRSGRVTLGFSPCPNDTFIFHALVHGVIPLPELEISARLEDVETLNRLALAGELDVSKVSYGALPPLLDRYALLRSGGALGRGCGPLLVAREPLSRERLRRARLAIPGRLTTANLLLRLWDPELPPGHPLPYDEIAPAVAAGEADAGLIIHESRFTYAAHGLLSLVDLGEWWESETGLPIPLGTIVAKRELGPPTLGRLESAIRASVEHALAHPDDSADYVSEHAREMDPEVLRRHIELYVNRFSVELGDEGEEAVETLLARGRAAGILPASPAPFPG